MKTKIDNYTFNKTAKTVTFTDYTSIRLDAILLITNVTDNIIIYNFADTSKGGTVLTNVLTLTYDTSSMDDADKLLIYYDDIKEVQKVEEQNPKKDDIFKEFVTSIKKEESGEFNTIDENLRMVLGTERLVTQSKKLNVNTIPDYLIVSKNLAPVTNSSFMLDVIGYCSLAIQVSGTWAGTISFECSVDGANFIAMGGLAINGTTIVASTTANNIFRFNVAALYKVQVRFSTATSGNPIVQFMATSEPSTLITNTTTVAGAVTTSGTATVSGAVTTTDSVLPGSIITQAQPLKVIPVAPTPVVGINNFLSTFPQIFQRLRVDAGGSNRTPLKQEDNTDKLSIGNEEERVLLQNILRQLEISNIFKFQELDRNGHPNLKIPEGFNEY